MITMLLIPYKLEWYILCSASDGSEGVQSSQSSVEEEAKQGSDILYTHCTLHSYTVSYSMLLFNLAVEMLMYSC